MNTKRWIAIFLAIVLTLSLIAGVLPTVFSAEAYTISLKDGDGNAVITANPGDTVECFLYISGNPGILSAGAQVKCPEGIAITDVQSALSNPNFTPVWQFSKAYTDNPYLVWMLAPTGTSSQGLVTYNGKWCKITLEIDADLAYGEYTVKLSAPKDKNLTAQTNGGVIKPDTNSYVSGISVANLTVSVEEPTCNHTWGQWTTTVNATCLNAGKQERECTSCHQTQQKEVAALGHQMGAWTQTAAPTCTNAGSEKRVCQNGCGHTETREIKKLGHQFSNPTVTKEPTCTKEGEKTGVCSRCGKNTKESIPATGHSFSAPEIVRQPTAEKTGLKRSKCSRCGEVKEESIPRLSTETTEATTEATTESTTEATTETTAETTTEATTDVTTEATTEATTEVTTETTTEETTQATTEVTTETTTGTTTETTEATGETTPEQTPGATTLPEDTTGAQTLPGESIPQETQPVTETPEQGILKTVIIVASILLLSVLSLIVVIAIRSKRK